MSDADDERMMPKLLVGYRGEYSPRKPRLFAELEVVPPKAKRHTGRPTLAEAAELRKALSDALAGTRANVRKLRDPSHER